MQCPACNYVLSDKHDECPKCDIDLRPYKRDMGIKVNEEKKETKKAEEKPKNTKTLKKNLDRTKKNILSAVVDDEELKRRVVSGANKKTKAKSKSATKPKEAKPNKKPTAEKKKSVKKEVEKTVPQASLEEQLKITVENQQTLITQLIELLAAERKLDAKKVQDELCKIPTLPSKQDILNALDAVREIDIQTHPEEYEISKALWESVEKVLLEKEETEEISIDHVISWSRSGNTVALFDSVDNALCGQAGVSSVSEFKSSVEAEIDNSELSEEFTRLEEVIEQTSEDDLTEAALVSKRKPKVFSEDEAFEMQEVFSIQNLSDYKIITLSILASGIITPMFLVPDNMTSLLVDLQRLFSFESILYFFRWFSTAAVILVGTYHNQILQELSDLIPEDSE